MGQLDCLETSGTNHPMTQDHIQEKEEFYLSYLHFRTLYS